MALGAIALAFIATGCSKAADQQSSTDNSQSAGTTTTMQDNNTQAGVEVGGAMMVPNLNIVQNAANANNVTTLVAAVKAAGLVATLSGPGPFTVFAPTNDAFNKLPSGTVSTLLKPENKAALADILEYHVVSGTYKSSDLKDGMVLTSVEGKQLKIANVNGKITINGVAMVQTADVISSNGVTHVIDTVLLPPTGVMVGGALMTPSLNIVQNAANASNVTTVVAAVKAAGLVATLSGKGPFTVFAPDNNAFAKLPAGTVDSLLKPENKATLAKILEYHVVAGRYQAKDLKDGMKLKTVEGETLTIGKDANGKITINGTAMVETADVISSNGVTFVIDSVLMPSSMMTH